jgi:trehalose-6-phosphate synthase
MPLSERRQRHRSMMAVIRRNDIHAWHRNFVAELETGGSTPRTDRPK